jgi:predicted MPP superfamily phosphohydrolase
MRSRSSLAIFIVTIQAILLLTHFFLFRTWTFSSSHENLSGPLGLKLVLGFLSVSFVAASLLAYRYTNSAVRALYKAAAVWLGFLSFVFIAAILTWLAYAIALVAGFHPNFHRMAEILFAAAFALGAYGFFNAGNTRITRSTIRLANLPETWRGRKAALISDVHLGHVRNGVFLRRMVRKILHEAPDAIFIAGDLYDGTAIDAHRAAQPLSQLFAPQGVYFVAGNHEQFGDDSRYLNAISAAGVRVLTNEKVEADGLQIVGIPYNNAHGSRFASVLHSLGLDRDRASILLCHAPDHPQIAEAAGISLQLSGHTHLGQFIPWSWFARRIYRQFVYGLSRIGQMQVFTSSGAGTWGPPFRLGSNPEIVVLQFE